MYFHFSLFALMAASVMLAAPVSVADETSSTERKNAPSAGSTVAYTNSMDVLDDRRVLGVGDRVSFRVVEDRKDPVSLVVTDSGEMEVPLIGRVAAASKTCKQLAYAIKGPLEKTYFYKATVIVGLDVVATAKSKGRVYVTGAVRAQGPIDIPTDETFTLSKAISRAGGLSDFANAKKIRLLRPGGPNKETQTFVINLDDIVKKGKLDQDPEVKPGDSIMVSETW